MRNTIYSGCAYPGEYEMLDPLRIASVETGHVYEKQLQVGGIAWFSDLEECDENAYTVACEIAENGRLYWLCNNVHATNSLLCELEEIAENGATPEYIAPEALQYIEEMEG